MKNVLVLIHDDVGQESRLQAALDITRSLDGHLTCLHVTIPPQAVPEVYVAVGYDLLLAGEKTREGANRARLEARLEAEDVSWNILEVFGDVAAAIKENAGLADVIVLNEKLGEPTLPDLWHVTTEAIVATRKPVIAIPEGAVGFSASGPALIAWDGSAQASAAVSAAVPLLQKAESVTILEVDDGDLDVPVEEAAVYLSRHGIEPQIVRRTTPDGKPAALILDEAARLNAAYIVMGGFGRSRLGEALFGGVTRTLLRKSPVPLLIAH